MASARHGGARVLLVLLVALAALVARPAPALGEAPDGGAPVAAGAATVALEYEDGAVSEASYPTVEAAFESLSSPYLASATVTLNADAFFESDLTVPAGVKATLDLNGHTLRGSEAGQEPVDVAGSDGGHAPSVGVFGICVLGDLTVADSSASGLQSGLLALYSPVVVGSEDGSAPASLTLESGTVEASCLWAEGAVQVRAGSSYVQSGGALLASFAEDTGAVGSAMGVYGEGSASVSGGELRATAPVACAVATSEASVSGGVVRAVQSVVTSTSYSRYATGVDAKVVRVTGGAVIAEAVDPEGRKPSRAYGIYMQNGGTCLVAGGTVAGEAAGIVASSFFGPTSVEVTGGEVRAEGGVDPYGVYLNYGSETSVRVAGGSVYGERSAVYTDVSNASACTVEGGSLSSGDGPVIAGKPGTLGSVSVKGGTFYGPEGTERVVSKYLAAGDGSAVGYKTQANVDGSVSVVESDRPTVPGEPDVGDTLVTVVPEGGQARAVDSIEGAIAYLAANGGAGEVLLNAACSLDDGFSVPAGADVTLRLSGQVYTDQDAPMTVEVYGSLEIVGEVENLSIHNVAFEVKGDSAGSLVLRNVSVRYGVRKGTGRALLVEAGACAEVAADASVLCHTATGDSEAVRNRGELTVAGELLASAAGKGAYATALVQRGDSSSCVLEATARVQADSWARSEAVDLGGGTMSVRGGQDGPTLSGIAYDTAERTGSRWVYGVYASGGSLEITGGTVSGDVLDQETGESVALYDRDGAAYDAAYGMFVSDAAVSVSGGSVSGAIQSVSLTSSTDTPCTLDVSGGTFTGSKCALYVASPDEGPAASVNVSGGSFVMTDDEFASPAILLRGGELRMSGGSVTSGHYGIGVEKGYVELSGSTVVESGRSAVSTDCEAAGDAVVRVHGGTYTAHYPVEVVDGSAAGDIQLMGGRFVATEPIPDELGPAAFVAEGYEARLAAELTWDVVEKAGEPSDPGTDEPSGPGTDIPETGDAASAAALVAAAGAVLAGLGLATRRRR